MKNFQPEPLLRLIWWNLYQMKKYKTMKTKVIPINKIEMTHDPAGCPNDQQIIDDYHREGIELVKKLIGKGYSILPILVREIDGRDEILDMYRKNYKIDQGKYFWQRMDGFKRLMAHFELGYTEIEAFIDQNAVSGGQEKRPWIVSTPVLKKGQIENEDTASLST